MCPEFQKSATDYQQIRQFRNELKLLYIHPNNMQPGKLLKDYRITNQRADAPDTSCWKDIFDQKIRGETANDLYVEQVERENREQLQDAQAGRVRAYIDKVDADSQDSSDISGLSELDDDEKEMIAMIKAERIERAEEELNRQRFGRVFKINSQNYCETVQQNDHSVVIHICSEHLPACKKIDLFFNQLAEKYQTVKFCNIDYLQAAKNYPESNCPTILIYQNGQLEKQFQGIHNLGGMNGSLEDIELILQDAGVIITDIKDNKKHLHNYFKMDV